jgi:predicted transcriptional regulator
MQSKSKSKITLRLQTKVKERIQKIALDRNCSMNELIEEALRLYISIDVSEIDLDNKAEKRGVKVPALLNMALFDYFNSKK